MIRLKNPAIVLCGIRAIQQAASATDRPAHGPVWASRTKFPAPKDNAIVATVIEAIVNAGDDSDIANELLSPSIADVGVQWSGCRSGVGKDDKEPDISEKEKHEGLMRDTRSKTTILYVHGGFY